MLDGDDPTEKRNGPMDTGAVPVGDNACPVCDLKSNFGAVLDTITDGVIVIDAAGIIRLLNPAAEQMFGYRRDEILGQDVQILMPVPDRELHGRYLEQYLRTGNKKIIGIGREAAGQRKDGNVFPLYLSIGELYLGTQHLFVGIARDLSGQKQAEDQLLVLSRAVNQSPVAVVITDLEGRIDYVNQGFTRLTGYEAEEVIGSSPYVLRSGPTLSEGYRELWKAMLESREWHGEIQGRKKDGSLYWALETFTPIRDAAGKVTRYLGLQQDITQQKKDRENLEQSEARFRHVADMVGEWLWEQDAGGRYSYSSAAVQDILGYRPEEIIGKHYFDLMTEEDRAHWMKALPPADQLSSRFRKLTNRYRHRDGHEVYTESSGEPLLDAGGRVRTWRGMDLDITDRKRFEDELHLRDRAIEAANVGIAIASARQPDFPTLYVNSAFSRLTGCSRKQLLGRQLCVFPSPDTEEAVREEIHGALREGRAGSWVFRNSRRDGTGIWIELMLSPVRDEMGALTHYICVLADVSEHRRAEEERRELEIAKQIQLSLLPKTPLRIPGIDAAGVCVPATHVGGDYFDFFSCGSHVDLAIADVSGHSVGAALIMSELRSTLKAEIRRNRSRPLGPAELLSALNYLLHGDLSEADLFITMFYLRYDPATRALTYANAGHNRVLLLRRDATVCCELDADGLILGIRGEVQFEEQTLMLEPGDLLLLYTDGAIEARNEAGNFYGLPRLCTAFREYREYRPEALLRRLLDSLQTFRGKSELQDDVTLVTLQIS